MYNKIKAIFVSKILTIDLVFMMGSKISMGFLSWTKHRVSNGAVEGMNNKIKSISHRSFGFRTAQNFIAAIYHCCAKLPLPLER